MWDHFGVNFVHKTIVHKYEHTHSEYGWEIYEIFQFSLKNK